MNELEHEINELKEKKNEEMNQMKQNQEKMQSELLLMRQFIRKYVPNECMPQNINGDSSEEIPDAVRGQERVPQTSRIPSVAKNTPPHGFKYPNIPWTNVATCVWSRGTNLEAPKSANFSV
ncbi:hypothetical protein HAX54_005492 [Datura stramonium]|uniref:Uncharacterized protein n=1 Tax=Datura stramonium TaxID=4076 RepID=A0ABS8TA87_DATST|nr:hypothetical protein [Datura stramonium]